MIYVLLPWFEYEGFSRPVRAFSTEEEALAAFDKAEPKNNHEGYAVVAVPLDAETGESREVTTNG